MKKLLDREPTEEMLETAAGPLESFKLMARAIWYAAFDAAPEIKVDMEPVAWILPTDPVRIVDHMNFNANYGGTVKELYSAEQVVALQAQLAERDKLLEQCEATILEQQARIRDLDLGIYKMTNTPADNFIHDAAWAHSLYSEARRLYELRDNNLSALEAALKAERIKTLEEVAANTCMWKDCRDELRRMIKEIKDAKNE